jgi:Flp pilus assembly CpaE family ATPase
MAGGLREKDDIRLFQHPEAPLEDNEAAGFDHLVVSDRYFAFPAFCEYAEQLKERFPELQLTVLLSDRHNAAESGKWITYCLVNDVHFVPAHRTRESLNRAIMQRLYGEGGPQQDGGKGGGKTFVFVGSTPNIGTTVVSFGAAVGMACRTGRSVAYLCLNLKSSKLHRYVGLDKPEASLDHLRAEIRSLSLRPDRLEAYCEPVKGIANLRVLFGNQLREQAEFFTPEDIEHLLQTAKRTFDMCIVEVNAYWDNAATICALLQADSRILVTTPELTHFQEDTDRWLRGLCPIIGLAPDSFDLVLTQADKNGGSTGIRQSDIRKETGLTLIGKVGKYAELTETVNQGKLPELLLGAHPLCRDLGAIVTVLSAVSGIPVAVQPSGRPWKRWLGKLSAKPGKAGQTVWGS